MSDERQDWRQSRRCSVEGCDGPAVRDKIVQLLWQDYDVCDHRGVISIARDATMMALYQEYCKTYMPASWLTEKDIGFISWLIQEKGATMVEIEDFDLNVNPSCPGRLYE